MRFFLTILLTLLFYSCASKHAFMKGTVALKTDETRGIVCLESHLAQTGMRLKLLNNNCDRSKFPDSRAVCELVEDGEIEITKILNEHYAEFRTTSAQKFNEGSIIATPR